MLKDTLSQAEKQEAQEKSWDIYIKGKNLHLYTRTVIPLIYSRLHPGVAVVDIGHGVAGYKKVGGRT